MEFVQRTSMYGFQPEPQCFARVWLRDPGDLVKVVAVLEVRGSERTVDERWVLDQRWALCGRCFDTLA